MNKDVLDNEQVHLRLNDLKAEIRRSWQDYKRYRSLMYDEEIRDNAMLMILVYLIRKGML